LNLLFSFPLQLDFNLDEWEDLVGDMDLADDMDDCDDDSMDIHSSFSTAPSIHAFF